jgi:hypothetical protein
MSEEPKLDLEKIDNDLDGIAKKTSQMLSQQMDALRKDIAELIKLQNEKKELQDKNKATAKYRSSKVIDWEGAELPRHYENCRFCHKKEWEVKVLVTSDGSGFGGFICNECVDRIYNLIHKENKHE